MIASRISQNSSDINEFQKAKPIYEDALKKSGYDENLQYASKPNLNNTHQSIRKRKIIWFNPPFNSAGSTNVSKEFLKLLDKHFPLHHKLHKICNRNNVKLSYSCMQNMQAIINRHNKTLLAKKGNLNTTSSKTCNCRVKADCPLRGNCLVKSIVYQATLESSDGPKIYYGSCSTTFKARFYNHNQSFKHPKKRHATELSKVVWKEKDRGLSPKITWQIAMQASAYSSGSRSCNLCLE